LEHEAVVEYLSPPITERTDRGLVFDVGRFQGKQAWDVAVVQVGPGSIPAGVLLDRVGTSFTPEVAIFVGVAGGLKDVAHGDVVVADAVYDYEAGADDVDEYRPRIKTAAPSFALMQRARAVTRRQCWQDRISPPPARRPSAFVKPAAAGNKVVVHDRSATARLLRRYCGDALCVDMESYGFLHGAYLNEGLATLVVRGISDLLSDKTAANDRTWQVPAARHAAAFAFEVLSTLDIAIAHGSGGERSDAGDQLLQVNNASDGGSVFANQGGTQMINVPGRGGVEHESIR
jgi:nucleoside phosphorylase